MLLPAPRADLSQGDICDGVAVCIPDGGQCAARQARVIVLSHDCELDKPNERGQFALAAEVRRADEIPKGTWLNIVAGNGWNALYLPGGAAFGDAFIDFGRIHRVQRAALDGAVTYGRRLASLTDSAREAVVYALTSYFLHEDILPPIVPPAGNPPVTDPGA